MSKYGTHKFKMKNFNQTKIRFSPDSYVVKRLEQIFVVNQKSGKELLYDTDSLYWLNKISYIPQDSIKIVESVKKDYPQVSTDTIKKDFESFIKTLKEEGIVIADNGPASTEEARGIVESNYLPVLNEITIELTNICNERCIHCYLGDNKFKHIESLSEEQVKGLIYQFVRMGGREITFTGGEIFLYPKLWEVLEYANSYDIGISLFSNLINLNDEDIRKLKKLHIVDIQTSLYSSVPAIHNRITRIDKSCEKTVSAITKLKKNKLPIRIACPIMKENKDSIVELIKFCQNNRILLNIDINIQAQYDGNLSNLSQRLSLEEMESTLADIKKYDKEFCHNYLKRHCFDKNLKPIEFINQPICSAGHDNLYICSNGNIAPCPTLQGYYLGNIKTHSLSEVWTHNKRIKELRNATQTNFPKCLSCELIDYCGRCFAVNFTEQKNIWEIPEYKCSIAQIAKKIVEM